MISVVTGANGFIGARLSAVLAELGHDVRPVVRGDFERDGFERKIRGAETVFHLAGATRAPTVAQLQAANVDLTRRVVQAMRTTGVQRLVFVSSQAAAGPASSLDRPTRETDFPAPVEAYGRSKLDAERVVLASGLATVIVRPGAVYGPNDKDFRTAFSLAHRGLAIHPGNRAQWISIIHVDDCIQGIVRAADATGSASPVYFLANDQPAQWSEIFKDMARAAGRRLSLDIQVPMPLVQLAARAGDVKAHITGRAGLLTTEKVALGKAPYWVCSSARAKRELGFAPRVSLHDGLLETYRWYLEHGGL